MHWTDIEAGRILRVMTKSELFTVFGATGHTGSIVASQLLAAGHRVRAVVRHPDKAAGLAARGAALFAGEVGDRAAVTAALTGATGAYLLVPPALGAPDFLAYSRAVVENYAAGLAAARPRHAVYLSSVGAQVDAATGPIRGSRHGELTLVTAGPQITFVRAPFFMENLLGSAHAMKAEGVLPVFGGGEARPFPMIATRDIAEAAAQTLLAPPSATEWIELHGPRDYSYVDAAAAAAQVLGRPVTATPVPLDAMVPQLTRFGFSASVAGLFRELYDALGHGLVVYENKGRQVTGRVELADLLRTALS
jgi:uncharacterized protein YbjT (DUF2867 family)